MLLVASTLLNLEKRNFLKVFEYDPCGFKVPRSTRIQTSQKINDEIATFGGGLLFTYRLGPAHSHWFTVDSRKVDEGPLLNLEPSRSVLVQDVLVQRKRSKEMCVRGPTKWGCVNEWWDSVRVEIHLAHARRRCSSAKSGLKLHGGTSLVGKVIVQRGLQAPQNVDSPTVEAPREEQILPVASMFCSLTARFEILGRTKPDERSAFQRRYPSTLPNVGISSRSHWIIHGSAKRVGASSRRPTSDCETCHDTCLSPLLTLGDGYIKTKDIQYEKLFQS